MTILQHSSASGFTTSELVRLGAELSLGVEPADMTPQAMATPVFAGRLLAQEVQPGLTATVSDVTYLSDQAIAVEMEASLMCGLLLEGEDDAMEIGPYGRVAKQVERAVLVGFCQPTRCRRPCIASHRACAAGFVLKPGFFDRFGEDVTDDGLAALREFVRVDFRTQTLARSPRLTAIARRYLDHPYNGRLGLLFLEGNTLSFVAEVAELLKQERRMTALIGRRHYERVMEARDILDAQLVEPPSTLQLARRVGVSVTTLQANFKAVFDTTVFGYVRDQRLMMARVLLLDHGLSAAEAGYRVGFASPAAFTAAYRRYFGCPPGRDRSRHAAMP